MKFTVKKTVSVGKDVWTKHSVRRGYVDLNDLRGSKFKKIICLIPQENQIELNNTGNTEFTVVTKTVVSINKKATL